MSAALSVSQFKAIAAKPKRSKFGNVKTVVDGITFDSKLEARRWGQLQLLVRAGLIKNLRRQVPFFLIVNEILICKYVADFTYNEASDNAFIVEDTKGFETEEFQLKSKLMLACHGLSIRLVRS